MALNVYGKESWATKITSMLEDSYTQYDASDYDTAPANNEWIIAEELGTTRETTATGNLSGVTFNTCFHGLDDLTGVTEGHVIRDNETIPSGSVFNKDLSS